MAKPALLIRLYGSIENARAAYAIDALRKAMRCEEQEPGNDRAGPQPGPTHRHLDQTGEGKDNDRETREVLHGNRRG
jgi:hypothetical protein